MPREREQQLEKLKQEIIQCRKCPLGDRRTLAVPGEGSVAEPPKVMFIGEAPGGEEDSSGRPFVGRSGQLLTRIIENGMHLSRAKDVYITNLLKCRPFVYIGEKAKDRPPQEKEIAACQFFLNQQIQLLQPRIIVAVGSPAMKVLLNNPKFGITKMHGQWGEYLGIPVMPIFHPSYVLRNGGEKSPLREIVWQDIQKVMRRLEEKGDAQDTL